MLNVNQAFILAAGFGTRLLPLTRVVPKPLLPLGGVPMLERALAMVRSWGVREVVVNVHHGADAIVCHLINRTPDGLKIAISFEPEILGTGGALTKAAWFFREGKPFWMVNADVAADVDGKKIARVFRPGKTIAAAWLMESRGPRTVECVNGTITNFQSKRPRTAGTYTFCGVHLVDPAVVRYLPETGFASIIDAYQKAMGDGWSVAGVPIENAYWADIGTPAQYVEAKVGTDVPSVRSENVAIINNVIYGPHVPRKKYSGIMVMRALDALDAHELATARRWPAFRDTAIACPLSPRGSARSFTRLYSGRDTAMLVRHQPEREENNLYVTHTKFLRSLRLPVPKVLAVDATHHLALFSDVGVNSVQDQTDAWRKKHLEPLYGSVLETMVRFHEAGARAALRSNLPLMPGFDAKLYEWEHDLFARLFLRERCGMDEAREAAVRQELKTVSQSLVGLPPVLLHRDFQSSNILVQRGIWSLIDYQGMRLGPAVYDLASLLCDPYITMSPACRERLLGRYATRAQSGSRCQEMFWSAVVQRLGQALGAYARLSALPGTGHFVRYIPPALRNMADALRRVDGLPELTKVVDETIERENKR
jgi:aminoglycoside/choline kinase family phosphotransferase/dTDP-glucose pyrophosphorylase